MALTDHAGSRRTSEIVAVAVGLVAVIVAGWALATRTNPSAISPPNAVDVGFCQDMSVHHEQAILMSQLALTHGTSAIQAIALSILSSQSEEVGAMRGSLRVWGKSVIDPTPMSWAQSSGQAQASMSGMSMSGPLMPGMATSAQLLKLHESTGKAFDVLFLQLMVRHHRAGVAMARAAITNHASSLITTAAQQMIVEQVEDIGTLDAVLTVDGGHELPA